MSQINIENTEVKFQVSRYLSKHTTQNRKITLEMSFKKNKKEEERKRKHESLINNVDNFV